MCPARSRVLLSQFDPTPDHVACDLERKPRRKATRRSTPRPTTHARSTERTSATSAAGREAEATAATAAHHVEEHFGVDADATAATAHGEAAHAATHVGEHFGWVDQVFAGVVALAFSVNRRLWSVMHQFRRKEGWGWTYCESLNVSYASPISLNFSAASSSSGFLSG